MKYLHVYFLKILIYFKNGNDLRKVKGERIQACFKSSHTGEAPAQTRRSTYTDILHMFDIWYV